MKLSELQTYKRDTSQSATAMLCQKGGKAVVKITTISIGGLTHSENCLSVKTAEKLLSQLKSALQAVKRNKIPVSNRKIAQ